MTVNWNHEPMICRAHSSIILGNLVRCSCGESERGGWDWCAVSENRPQENIIAGNVQGREEALMLALRGARRMLERAVKDAGGTVKWEET